MKQIKDYRNVIGGGKDGSDSRIFFGTTGQWLTGAAVFGVVYPCISQPLAEWCIDAWSTELDKESTKAKVSTGVGAFFITLAGVGLGAVANNYVIKPLKERLLG